MYRLFTSMVVLVLIQVGFFTPLNGQGCNLKTGVLALACTAGASLSYEDGIDCYSEIRMLLEAGTFYAWTANDTDGWIVEQLAPNELLVTHLNGTFPSGDHTMVNFLYYTPGGAPTQLILLYPDLCVMEGCENQHTLPGCGESCISGTIYRECGAAPLTDQPRLEGFIVELSDEMGNLVSEYTTGPDGSYTFCDLVPGGYSVKAAIDTAKVPKQGWSPKVPASGEYAIVLPPGAEEFRNFGSCPECDCNDVETLFQEDVSFQDSSVYDLCLFLNNIYCFEKLLLEVDSGEIMSWENLPADWEANLLSPTMLELTLSFVHYEPCKFRVAMTPWGDPHENVSRKWTIKALGFDDIPDPLLCVDTFVFEHPSKYKQFTCCPDGTIQGPELVQNGQFFIITPPSTDYNYKTTPSVPGDIAILSQANAYAANNTWICGAVGGPLDHYLVADGSSTGGLSVWKQQVTGLIADDSYVFCALFNNLVKPALDYDDPIVELVIEDDFNTSNSWSSGPLTLPEVPDNWEQLSLNWTVPSPASASYTLKIISQGTSFIGNDFAVDEIGFKTCEAVKDTCCKNLENFCADLDAGILFSFDSCKVTMDLSALPPCYLIEWVDWGQGPEFGPWTSSTIPPPMHTFSGNGTYPISYLAIAYNDSNFICIEKVVEDTIVVQCEPCLCNEPEISLNLNGVDYPLSCSKGAPLVQLPCPAGDILLSGFFGCEKASGELCEETPVFWTIAGPNNYFDSGSTTNFQALFFAQNIISTPGQYTVTYSTLCAGATDSCLCTVQWLQQDCDTCYCGGFTDMFVRTPQGAMNMAVACGDAPLTIPCPDPGKGFYLTGVFDCAGGGCPPDHQIDWSLLHQGSGTTHSGSFVDNDPFFGIHILPTYISQPGIYTLTMTGYCNGDSCVCEFQFIIDCPNLCPCDIADILDLSDRVDQGFAVALANKSCKACFSPLAVNDCETVEWFVNTTSGTPIGASVGPATFCYNFPFSGTYTIYMVVTRLKPDGSICEVFTYGKTITVSCLFSPVCDAVFPNPRFAEGAIAGNMTMGGEAPGWVGEGLYPTVLEGVPESEDAWSILLTGCYFNSDVLSSANPVCLSKTDTGTITLRLRTPGEPIPGADVKVGRKPPGGNNIIIGYGINLNQQAGHQRLAIIEDLLPLEDDDWYDLYIPYDLNNWEPEDSCGDLSGGLPGYLGIWMSNMLSSDQGDGVVRDAVIIDHICMDATLVNTANPVSKTGMHIQPNPTNGILNLFLPEIARRGDYLRVLGLTGQVLFEQPLQDGTALQEIDLARLPAGLYFLEVFHLGKQHQMFRIIKQ